MEPTKLVKTQSGKDLLSANTTESRQVFGKLLYEGELGILFGDSNTGKSILANDIAFFVCGGGHEWKDMVSPNIPTMYIDMEMRASQFANRYRNAGDYMTDNYKRAEVNVLMSKEDNLFNAIKTEIIYQQGNENPPKFIIIDNITNGFGSILSATKMRTLISDLKNLKDRFDLTILLIAHCPKRKKNKPITDNDLGGSSMLIKFCDSAFAIAPSYVGDEYKYLKQIKTREREKMKTVMTLKIVPEPYLHMEYIDNVEEDSHLNPKKNDLWYLEITPEIEIKLVRLLKDKQYCYSEIAEELGISLDAVVSYNFENNLAV